MAFDYGNATRKALATGRGGAGEWDKGNGSLMRCLPMVFMDCTSAEVRAVSAITHATDACMDACEKMIRYAARLMCEGSPAGESAGEPGGEQRLCVGHL